MQTQISYFSEVLAFQEKNQEVGMYNLEDIDTRQEFRNDKPTHSFNNSFPPKLWYMYIFRMFSARLKTKNLCVLYSKVFAQPQYQGLIDAFRQILKSQFFT